MFRFKRLLILLTAAAFVAAIVLFAAREKIAGWIVHRAIAEAQARAAARGIQFIELEPGLPTFTGLFTLQCEGLRGRMLLPRGLVSDGSESYSFVARRLRVHVSNVFTGRLVVALGGGSVYKLRADGNASGEWLSDLTGECAINASWINPRATVAMIEEQLRHLIERGTMTLPARVRGRARFLVRRDWFEAAIYSETDGRQTRIALDREDVKRVSEGYIQQLTEHEINLVAGYPTLAPVLLSLADKAKRVAVGHKRTNPGFPEDAFRHVYWSFLLTREFGAEFAEVVTDAHEFGATYETAEADRIMDLANNALGRDYARSGVAESDIKQRVLTDVRVRKKAR